MAERIAFLEANLQDKCFFYILGKRKKSSRETSRVNREDESKHEPSKKSWQREKKTTTQNHKNPNPWGKGGGR